MTAVSKLARVAFALDYCCVLPSFSYGTVMV